MNDTISISKSVCGVHRRPTLILRIGGNILLSMKAKKGDLFNFRHDKKCTTWEITKITKKQSILEGLSHYTLTWVTENRNGYIAIPNVFDNIPIDVEKCLTKKNYALSNNTLKIRIQSLLTKKTKINVV